MNGKQIGGYFALIMIVLVLPLYKYLRGHFPLTEEFANMMAYLDIFVMTLICLSIIKFFPIPKAELKCPKHVIPILLTLSSIGAVATISSMLSFVVSHIHKSPFTEAAPAFYSMSFRFLIVALFLAPLFEEYYFRYATAEAAQRLMSKRAAWILSSMTFAFCHLDFSNAIVDCSRFLQYLGMGFIFFAVRRRFGLIHAFLAHALNNAFALGVPHLISVEYSLPLLFMTFITLKSVIIPAWNGDR